MDGRSPRKHSRVRNEPIPRCFCMPAMQTKKSNATPEENKRLREALEKYRNSKNWGVYGDFLDCEEFGCELADKALRGESVKC